MQNTKQSAALGPRIYRRCRLEFRGKIITRNQKCRTNNDSKQKGAQTNMRKAPKQQNDRTNNDRINMRYNACVTTATVRKMDEYRRLHSRTAMRLAKHQSVNGTGPRIYRRCREEFRERTNPRNSKCRTNNDKKEKGAQTNMQKAPKTKPN